MRFQTLNPRCNFGRSVFLTLKRDCTYPAALCLPSMPASRDAMTDTQCDQGPDFADGTYFQLQDFKPRCSFSRFEATPPLPEGMRLDEGGNIEGAPQQPTDVTEYMITLRSLI